MGTDWLDLSDRGVDSPTVLERLMRSPFDELVEIDFINDMCRNLCHAEGKYHVPVYSGSWSEIYEYSLTHMVHPDDREAYAAMRRSTNGGGENSPLLSGEDDYYEMFFASL